MKVLKIILSIVLLTTISSCKDNTAPEIKNITINDKEVTEKKLNPNATYVKAEFNIEGMTCAVGCAATIQKKLNRMDGVKHAVVDFDKQLAMVEYDNAAVTTSSLETTVTGVASTYKVKNMKTVNTFSNTTKCKANCKKACCANKA